jgi:aminopeptidase YwaD
MLMVKGLLLRLFTCLVPVAFLFLSYSCGEYKNVTAGELQDHISYLSSDSLKGRMTGSEGDSLAAEYIRSELLSNGLVPLNGDGFQRFSITSRLVSGPENSLFADEKILLADKDFMPFSFSSSSGLISEAVFAGYGFNINTDSLKWNDYQDIDVKDKWVMILRADPETDKAVSPFIPYSSDRGKAMLAKDMGAAGVLLVSGQSFDQQDNFESLNSGDFSVEIPVLRIKREAADIILFKTGKKIIDLEKRLNQTRKPFSFSISTTISGKAEIIRETGTTRNVVMLLPGEDENLRKEYVIIGAHFDHLGMGGQGSSSRAVDTVAVHHGADDNASGVGMMLELAEKLAHTKGSHKRSIIFIAFTGEELGLLGSKEFVEHPDIDLTKVNAMINLDMVGRLQETNIVQISGVGTADGLKDLINSENDTTLLRLTLSDEGYGPSDHSSFYGKNIPVLFISTGAHLDYHTPSDTYDRINYKGMVTVSSLVYKVTEKLVNSPERLKFKESGPRIDYGRQVRRKGVTLGIMPDFAGNIKNGLRADFVTPGKPAALGGMKKGDIIKSINAKSVNNIQDYMFRMGQLKHGETISVEVLRDEKQVVLIIQL